MLLGPGGNLLAHVNVVHGLQHTTPSSSTPKYMTLKDQAVVGVLISYLNAAVNTTGSAITLNQALTTAGGSSKALGFTTYYTKLDSANTDAWTKATASSNTFTTATTASQAGLYFIPVDPATLDTANSFDCINCGTANAANTTISVLYLTAPKHGGNPILFTNTKTD